MERSRILVIHLPSTYTRLVADKAHSTAVELVDSGDSFVSQIVSANTAHEESLVKVAFILKERRITAVWKNAAEEVNPDEFDLVVTVGGDGTVLHASHSIGATPVLAVNSSPMTSAGYFTAATADNFGSVLDKVLSGQETPFKLFRMKIEVEGRVVAKRALNDALFCHDCPGSTTRYIISFNEEAEDQVSSGVWVSTAAGSTAAISAAGGKVMPPGSKRLQFAVREPFPTGGAFAKSLPKMTKGYIPENGRLTIRSKTEAARLYIDGPHVVFPVDFGNRVVFSRSNEPLRIFGYNKKDK